MTPQRLRIQKRAPPAAPTLPKARTPTIHLLSDSPVRSFRQPAPTVGAMLLQ